MEQFSTTAVAAIIGVPCIVVSLTVGALPGVLIYHLITRVQSKPQSQTQTQKPVPMYEDVQNIYVDIEWRKNILALLRHTAPTTVKPHAEQWA